MPASVAMVALAMATLPTDVVGNGMARISKSFAVAEQAMGKVEDGTGKTSQAAVVLGRLLGESRNAATQISSALVDQRTSSEAVRLVEWNGTFEAYLSASILGLDGDESSLTLSRILGARLRREIDRRSK
ncbi:MAG: hypothetical protein JSS65_07520 [Armatimonadetes bacterium]|nr:hypothetical protein [Armatimonadota bacterium]